MLPPAATVMPASNTYIANTSQSNVTYMCQLAVDSPEDTYVLWALNNDQIKNADQQMMYENTSVFIEPLEGSTSTLTVTPEGRMFLGQHLTLTCYAKTRGIIGATEGTDYFIVQYGEWCFLSDIVTLATRHMHSKLTYHSCAEVFSSTQLSGKGMCYGSCV